MQYLNLSQNQSETTEASFKHPSSYVTEYCTEDGDSEHDDFRCDKECGCSVHCMGDVYI